MIGANRTRVSSETRRRWRIPPPLLRDADAPGPEGLHVVNDFQNELGAVLWKSLRSVLLWADAPPTARAGLFSADTVERRQLEILAVLPEAEFGLQEALEALLPVLSRPEKADSEAIGVACTRIAAWCARNEGVRSALEFTQAASLACPGNGRYALAVGKGARDLAQYSRAEAWYYRAIGLARQARDWETYIRAYLSHGTMLMRRGALPAARRSFVKALRRARRQGLREMEAMTLHDLFVLEERSGNVERALRYASDAVEAYGAAHENLPVLAHDIAYLWLEQARYDHAMSIFMETLQKVPAKNRPLGLGSIARTAGGLKDRAAFEWARTELDQLASAPGVAESWVEVARGALMLGAFDEAREATEIAERVANQRGEGQVRFMATSVLEQIEAERRAEVALSRTYTPEPTTEMEEELARTLIRILRTEKAVG